MAFPGGKGEEGESAEAALVREMREELNVELTILDKICEYDLTFDESTSHNTVFLCKTEEEPIAGDDLVEVGYFDRAGILALHHNYHTLPAEVKTYVDSFIQ